MPPKTATTDPIDQHYGPAPDAPISWVEWRVQGQPLPNNRARFVPYLDSRHIALLLDGWVGPLNWRSSFEPCQLGGKPGLWGIVEIRHPERPDEWIAKRDVGVASDIESVKGIVSDAFKRSGCIMWGCGRNVYRMPNVVAPCRVTIDTGRDGKERRNARANAETLPFILAKLKEQGLDAQGSTVAGVDDEPEGEPTPVNGQAVAASPAARAPATPAPAKSAAKKATAKRAAAKQPATAPEGIEQEEVDELSAMLAALPEPEQARTFITSRQVNPDTWKGLTPGKVRAIRSALTNMAKVQQAGNPPLSAPPEPDGEPAPPAPPRPPAPPVAEPEHSVRVELAERAEKLPDNWGQVLRQEIASTGAQGLRGTTGEYVLGVPAGDDWDSWLESWISAAESKLLEDAEALPPGGEPY